MLQAAKESFCVFLFVFTLIFPDDGRAQNIASQDEVDPAEIKPYWLREGGILPAAIPFTLTQNQRVKFGGTFGVDISHYTFDEKSAGNCLSQDGYETPACSCTANWSTMSKAGVSAVYAKASDGAGTDLSFRRVWTQLDAMHQAGTLLRGAYHFFRPGIDAKVQADVFLRAIGAVNGHKPAQLLPVLDIEWSNKKIDPGSQEFRECPITRRTKTDDGRYFCDMWHKVAASTIASMAMSWINLVEAATGRRVLIYTNPTAWWNVVMSPKESYLIEERGVWTSRYTIDGPTYNPNWTSEGGSPHWKMAPLPRGASYPVDSYSIPHLWQFTETGYLDEQVLICDGHPSNKKIDMDWAPLSDRQFKSLFGSVLP